MKMDRTQINLWKSATRRHTLFCHRIGNVVFDCFPRSKSTLILSNIYSNNTGKSTNEWNQALRAQYLPSSEEIKSSKKIICLRSPQERFRSFLMSKIVNPHATSILPLFFTECPEIVKFLCDNSAGIKFSKSLNLLLNNADNARLFSELNTYIGSSPIFSKTSAHQRKYVLNFLHFAFNEYLKLDAETILKKLLIIVDKEPFLDPHLMSQSFLATFEPTTYDFVISVDNLHTFSIFYKEQTGFDFNFGKSNTSQKNTQYNFNESEIGHENVKNLRLQAAKKITPSLKSIFSPKNTWNHFKIYKKDYALTQNFTNQ